MKVKIEINGNNAAFFNEDEMVDFMEYARLLRELSMQVESEEYGNNPANIRDINGNVCGYLEISD